MTRTRNGDWGMGKSKQILLNFYFRGRWYKRKSKSGVSLRSIFCIHIPSFLRTAEHFSSFELLYLNMSIQVIQVEAAIGIFRRNSCSLFGWIITSYTESK
ncbi:MAG: hypothetical protein ACI90V_008240 [Bacillariaceae sp.]|jgi:hypothetical protein